MHHAGPTISALTILHNRAHLLAETIRSVLDQSYPVHEYIIIDDGSTDHPLAVISAFNDPRISYHYHDRVGVVSKLRNMAIYRSAGDYCAFIDSDDLWHRDKLKSHVEALTHGDPVLVLSDCQYFDADGLKGDPVGKGMLRKNDVFWELTERNQSLAFGSSLFFRNLPGITVFDESLYLGDHDFVTMLSAFHKTLYLDRVLNYIRLHPGNMSGAKGKRDVVYILEYNRTAGKLLAQRRISAKQFRHIKASNYIKTAFVFYQRGRNRKACDFAAASLRNRLTWPYLRFFLKVLLARARGK